MNAQSTPAPLHIQLPTGELQVTLTQGAARLDEIIGVWRPRQCQTGFLFVSKILAKHWPVKAFW